MSEKKSEQKKQSSSAVWSQIGQQAKGKQVGKVSGLNRSIDSTSELSGADTADLQQTYGNSFLQRVVQMGGGDSAEADSGSVAEDITPVNRDSASNPAMGGDESGVETRINRSRGQGQSLPDGLRGQMEGKFGADFSGVKIHNDGESDQLNRELGAKAFTTGSDIYFQQGQYNPGSQGGQKLIAHELTHVVQQGGAAQSSVQPKLEVSDPDDRFEKEAEQVADRVMSSVGNDSKAVGSGTTQTAEDGMTAEAEDAADKAGVSTSQVDSLTERANEKVEEGGDPKEVAKGAKKQITGNGGVGKPSETSGSMMNTEAKETESEAKKEKENHDPDKITAKKAAAGIKKPMLPDEDQAESLQFDETAIEEPVEAPLLPNWGELAYGTVQLFAGETASQEMNWREGHAANAATSAATASAAGASAPVAAPLGTEAAPEEPEPLDRDELIKDALVGGASEGIAQGAADFLADTLIENATNNIPYADGWIQLGNILADPDGWAEGVKTTFSADNAAKTFGGWGDISKETTTEGKVAFVLEKILGIIGWVEAINGFFQQMLQIGIAVLYLAWAIANSIPGGQGVAAAIMTVIKFLEMILKWLILLGNILLMMKPPLQITVIGLRIADLKKAEADPQTLLEKQAKLRGTTSAFATGVTQRSLQTAKTKLQEKRLKSAESTEETRKKIRDMDENVPDADTGKSKAEMMEDFKRETGNDVNTEPNKESSGKKAAKTAVAILLGVNPDKVSNEFRDAKNGWHEFKQTNEARKNREAINEAQSRVNDVNEYNEQQGAMLFKKDRLENARDSDLPAKRADIERRQQDLDGEITRLSSQLDTNTGDLDGARSRHTTLVADADVQNKKRINAEAEADSNSKIRDAEGEIEQAERGRTVAQEEYKRADVEQQEVSRKIDQVKKQLSEMDASAEQAKSAKKGEDGGDQASEARDKQRKMAEQELAQLESRQKEIADRKSKSKQTMDQLESKKRAAQENKQTAESVLAETRSKQDELRRTETQIAKFKNDIDTLEAERARIIERQGAAAEQGRGLEGERAKNDFDLEKTNRNIAKNEADLKKLQDDWALSKLGHEYLPQAGWEGTKQIFKGGEDHDFWASFMKDDGPTGKPSGNFGAGGQRHGSGITGAFAGGGLADKIWNYKEDMGAGDWLLDSITDRVQIAVDFENAPKGTATGPIECFHLSPSERFGDDSALAPLTEGDSFPDQIRTILPKHYFTDPSFTIQARSVMVKYSDKRTLFTPTVSAYTEVSDEGAIDEGSGEDRTTSGLKIDKFVFKISYTSRDLPLATKEDDSSAPVENGMLVQRQAVDEDEDPSVKRQEGEAEILEQLPEPPEEAIQTINSSAVAYNAMVAEEYAMQMQMQEIQQLEKDNEAQKLEAAAVGTAIETNQQAIDKHQQDTAQSQEAQKEMEDGAKQAEEPAKQGFDISQELSKLIQMLIQPLIAGLTTAGEESGSGNQSGGAGEVDKFGGMQGEAMDMATSTTAESQAQSRQWQGESAALSQDIKKQQGEYNQFGLMVGKQQDDLDSSADMLSDAQDTNLEGLEEIQDMMQDKELDHEESASEMDDWATEHQDMRLDLYEQLEADLAETNNQPIDAELEELGLE